MVKLLLIKICISIFLLSSCSTIVHNFLHRESSPTHEYEREYHQNGILQYETMYKNGVIDGHVKSWDSKGNIVSIVEYVNGTLHGHWETYYMSGRMKHSISYQYGKKNGVEVWYYDNGKKKSEATYVDDNIQSDIVRWDEEGRKIFE